MAEKKRSVPTIDELIELPIPSDVQLAPNGEHVAYVVMQPDWKKNLYIWQLWLVKAEKDATPRQLTFAKKSSFSPRWSPDGKWLVFLSRRAGDKCTQIYRMSPFGGEAERLTDIDTSVTSISWSPDGKYIAYRTLESESDADKKREEKYGTYRIEDEDKTPHHLWTFRLSDKKSRKLTGGQDLHVTGYSWSPDSTKIAFSTRTTPDLNEWKRSRICVVELESLERTVLTSEGCYSAIWSPDGQQLAFARHGEHCANNQICIMNADGQDVRVIPTSFDENIYLYEWVAEGLYFDAHQRTMEHLFRLDVQSGEVMQLTPNDVIGFKTYDYSFSQTFERVAIIASSATAFREIGVFEVSEPQKFTKLTDFNKKVQTWSLGEREIVQWNSTDGTVIEGVLTKPTEAKADTDADEEVKTDADTNTDHNEVEKRPLLVIIHGGPASVSQPELLGIHDRRYYPIQQWIEKGALVLQPNYRGSTGYGQAFRSLNIRNLGVGDYEDVISGVDALIKRGLVDPERVVVMGWSYGGYLSAFMTTKTDRFKAVCVGAGTANRVTQYTNGDVHNMTRRYLGATPWDDPDIYRQASPITYIKSAKTPTLIQHGEYDRRVPIAGAYELYQGLRDMGVETKMVMYPGGHNPSKPRQARQIMEENLAWFNRWLWEDTPKEADNAPCYVVLASEEQSDTEGEISAIQRYKSVPVQDVYHWARRDQTQFRILSPKFGLLSAEQAISTDTQPQLKAEHVSELALRIAEQLKEQKLDNLTLYTPKAKKEPTVLIALGCLQVAAGVAGDITIKHKQIAEKGWEKEKNGE